MKAITAASCCFALACHAGAQSVQFIPLGDLPGGTFASSAADVSPDGRYVVGSGSSTRGFWGESFLWTEQTGMRGLGVLPGHTQNQAGGVSPDGGWVVGRTVLSPEHTEAFAWSERTGTTLLGDLPGGDFRSIARGVSRNGRVIVGNASVEINGRNASEAFIWTPSGGMRGMGHLGGDRPGSSANDISADGRVIVGGSTTSDGSRAFRWTERDGMVPLEVLTDARPIGGARAVSPDGRWIAGASDAPYIDRDGNVRYNQQASLWNSDGEITGLGWLDDFDDRYSRAFDVSNTGTVIGVASGPTGGEFGFIWTPDHGMRFLEDALREDYGFDFSDTGWWRLGTPTGISADGRTIVGTGGNADNRREAWVIRLPIPAPASLAPLALAGALALRRRRL
jgi:probable HAF family extracellular repeat protein